jgi:hypothetical protein
MNRSGATIDFQLICTWLGLPAGSWPPDYYAMLGLPPCEPDVERIEQRIHERLIRLRSYQLSHPALATEAMTRLAKAFDCLTDPERKRAYDMAHWPDRVPPLQSRTPTVIANDTVETTPAPETPPAPPAGAPGWWSEPPPVRASQGTPVEPPPVRATPAPVEPPPVRGTPAEPPPVRVTPPLGILVATPVAPPPPVAPVAGPPSPTAGVGSAPVAVVDAPRALPAPLSESQKTRRLYLTSIALHDLGTRRDLYERLLWFRRTLRAWDRAGKYLNKPKRRLTRSAEDAELARLLEALDEVVQEGPLPLGQPGQPGYWILTLAGEDPVVDRFKALDEGQRDVVANDWSAGRTLLREYRELLKRHVKDHRRLSRWQRLRRNLDALVHAHWVGLLLAIGLLGVLAAVVVCLR